MNKKILIGGAIVSLALIISMGTVFAESENDNQNNDHEYNRSNSAISSITSNLKEENDNENESGKNEIQESAVIRQNGDFKITGAKVNSIATSTNTINVSLYGISRDINIGNAAINGANKQITIGDIVSGDILSASGNYNESSKTVIISEITDVTYKGRAISDIQQQINRLLEMIRQLQAQIKPQY